MSAVLDTLPYDNGNGGVWKQGFELSYSMTSFREEDPLQVFIMPHSHNDPGEMKYDLSMHHQAHYIMLP